MIQCISSFQNVGSRRIDQGRKFLVGNWLGFHELTRLRFEPFHPVFPPAPRAMLGAFAPGVRIVVQLGAALGDKASLVAFCTPAAVKAGHQAGKIIQTLSAAIGGIGGGKPDFAMGGGKDISKLADILK